MYHLSILVSEPHYKELKQLQKDLKLNGFENFSLSSIVSDAIDDLHAQYPVANPQKLDRLLCDQGGKKWGDFPMRRLKLTVHPDIKIFLHQLSYGFSKPTSNSQRVATALEQYLFRAPVMLRHVKKHVKKDAEGRLIILYTKNEIN